MKNRNSKGRLPPFTALINHTSKSAAWLAMSHGARSLFAALKSHYNRNTKGAVYLSTRQAEEELGAFSYRANIRKWFKELEYYGFIVKVLPAYLGIDGRGKAPHWRITDEWYHDQPPTRDFEKWDGKLFEEHKQRPPSYYKKLDFLKQKREQRAQLKVANSKNWVQNPGIGIHSTVGQASTPLSEQANGGKAESGVGIHSIEN